MRNSFLIGKLYQLGRECSKRNNADIDDNSNDFDYGKK